MPFSSTVDGERRSSIVPDTFVDYAVTEYGIVTPMVKTARQRAEERISVAHPNFRAELRRTRRRDTTSSRSNCR